jgi:hypothetical protein
LLDGRVEKAIVPRCPQWNKKIISRQENPQSYWQLSSIGALDPLNYDPLDLIERDLIAGAIVELGRARTLVRRHKLSILQSAAVVEIGCDPRCAERVAANIPIEPSSARL